MICQPTTEQVKAGNTFKRKPNQEKQQQNQWDVGLKWDVEEGRLCV